MKNPIWKYAIQTAALMAVGVLVFVIVLHLFGLNPFRQYEFMFLGIYALVLVFGGIRYRSKELKGYMEGWRAISFGLIANFFAALFYSGLLYGFFSVQPQAFERHKQEINAYVSQLKEYSETTENETEKVKTTLQNTIKEIDTTEITPIAVVGDKFLKMGALGVVVVMITAFLLRKSKPESAPISGESR